MTCSQCGIINAPGAVVCVHCGAPLTNQGRSSSPSEQAGSPPEPSDSPSAEPTPPPDSTPPGAPDTPAPPPGGPYGTPSPGAAYPSGGHPPAGGPEAGGAAPSGGFPPPGGPDPSGGYPSAGDSGGYPSGGYGPAPGQPPPGGPGYPDHPPGYPVGPPPPGGRSSGRGPLLIALAVLVVGALVAGAVLLLGGDDETGGLAGGSIRLEPLGSTQEDDFAGQLDVGFEELGESIAVALGEVPASEEQISTGLSGQVASGTEPGLYGGSQDTAVCNIEALVDFLTNPDNRDKAEAWAEVQGITVDGIGDFVAGLTPVRLRFDTRVTNHGFDGGATPFQSVLQAGTAVLVDDTGVPRVKCNCGNPLLPPEPVADASENQERALDLQELAANPDDAWDSLREDPGGVVTVEEGGEAVTDFTLLTLDDGRIIMRPVGTDGTQDEEADADVVAGLCADLAGSPTCEEPVLGTGDVQVTLRWDSDADLDLHVTDPNGEEIYYGSRTSGSGGELDVDANANCSEASPSPVENVFWPEGQAPSGTYDVSVEGYAGCNSGSGDYTLTVKVGGETVLEESGTVAEGESDPFSFEG